MASSYRRARASVFACGAILYEMATGMSVGPGMRRPSEVVPGLSEQFEMLLGKALVTDRNARPADLAALAQALHHCAPMAATGHSSWWTSSVAGGRLTRSSSR